MALPPALGTRTLQHVAIVGRGVSAIIVGIVLRVSGSGVVAHALQTFTPTQAEMALAAIEAHCADVGASPRHLPMLIDMRAQLASVERE